MMPRRMMHCAMALLLAAVAAGCASTSDALALDTQGRIWPEPPDAQRIAFVAEFSRPSDLGIAPGFWAQLVSFAAGPRKDQLQRPMDVVASNGAAMIYVADVDAHCVHRFDRERGRYDCLALGKDAALLSPVGLALTPSGRLYVADSMLRGIYTADPSERYLRRIDLGADLERPTGIAWDEDAELLFVADTGSQSIKAFRADGSFAAEFGERGVMPGQFNFPTYLWVDVGGEILVTDSLNFRVQRFGGEGAFLQTFGKNGDRVGDFARPKGIAVDSFGHLYVVDALFHGVQIFDASGQLLLAFGEQGQAPGQFWLPNGLYVTADNLILVADTYNRRVQVFRYVGSET